MNKSRTTNGKLINRTAVRDLKSRIFSLINSYNFFIHMNNRLILLLLPLLLLCAPSAAQLPGGMIKPPLEIRRQQQRAKRKAKPKTKRKAKPKARPKARPKAKPQPRKKSHASPRSRIGGEILRRHKEKLKQSTQQPEQSTQQSERRTQQPEQSKQQPERSTQQPEQSTQQPERSTQQPEQPTLTAADWNVVNAMIVNMVYVQGGTFMMGATSEQGNDAYSDKKPAHRVTLSGFYIGKYEVTQREWRTVMGSNPSSTKGDNGPVTNVSWNDCQEFLRRLNSLTGKNFRLPTEAEWEYAARGGNRSRGYKYSGSDNPDEVAWYSSNSGGGIRDVGTKRPNELGIYDMSGNVYEWCQDWYGSYNNLSQTNPTGSSSGSDRVYRGGCWDSNAWFCWSSVRNGNAPGKSISGLGLRLVLSE